VVLIRDGGPGNAWSGSPSGSGLGMPRTLPQVAGIASLPRLGADDGSGMLRAPSRGRLAKAAER